LHFELAAGFGATPRLPKIAAATSIDDAAAVEVGDASDPAAPLPLPPPPRPGAVYLTTRPAKKKIAFVTGTPITAAVAREVAELRRAREEATELAAAFYGGQRPTAPIATQPAAPGGSSSSSPRRKASSVGADGGGGQSQSARGPSPRRRASQEAAAHASKSASLQGSVSKQLGLDGTVASLEPAPSERLGFSHNGPQPQQSPYVALHAKDAVLAHLAAPSTYQHLTDIVHTSASLAEVCTSCSIGQWQGMGRQDGLQCTCHNAKFRCTKMGHKSSKYIVIIIIYPIKNYQPEYYYP
jgi:hypothetical protein